MDVDTTSSAIVPVQRSASGCTAVPQKVTTAQRLSAVAVLECHEPRLTVLQRIAVVDAAAHWVESAGGDELAWALLEAACRSTTAAGQTFTALLTAIESDMSAR
ncbi:hypothetical protein [Cryptosporangium sp. NPDC051539]|uniref:hypothetical protein n=1 Tax=Cryptosporangium sp. NPDC051539 TaxID=3363962 RepID=UPI0037879949